MNIVVGAWISKKFFDAFLVDGYQSMIELIDVLKSNFNDDTQVLNMFNYLDSDGNGTRNPFKLSLIPEKDFIIGPYRNFECKDIEDFKNKVDIPKMIALAWKNDAWWIYNQQNRNWRKVK